MNSMESEQLINNLCIRNRYKDRVLENRCSELRAAHKTLWKLKRQCMYFSEMLDKKQKDNSSSTASTEISKEPNAVCCPDLLAINQNSCDTRIVHSEVRKQQEEPQIHALPVASTSEDSIISKSISDCLLTEGESLKVTSQASMLLHGDASKTSNSLQNVTEGQRKALELDVMAFEKEELQIELACVLQEKDRASEDCAILKMQLEAANQHIMELQKQVAQRSQDVEMVAERLSHCEEQVKRYSQMVDDLEKIVQSKETARTESDSKVEELEELLMVLQSEKTEAAERIYAEADITSHDSAIRAVVQEKENMIDHLICEKDELDDRLVSQKNLVTGLQGKISELEEMLQQSNKRLEESKAEDWSMERKGLVEQVEILGCQLAQLQSELSGSQRSDGLQSQQMSQLFTLQVENLTLQTEKEDLENRLRQSTEESIYLKECNKELEIQLRCAEGNAGKNQELLKLKQQFLCEKSQLLHSIKNLQMELKEQHVLRAKSEDQLKLVESQNAELDSQLKLVELKNINAEAVDQLRHLLDIANRDIEALNYTVAESSGYLKELKSQNQKLQLESLQITEALGRTEEEFRRARTQDVERISFLQTELEQGLEERKNLQVELKSTKVKLCVLGNELEKVFAQNAKLENQLTNGKKELDEKQKLNLLLESERKRLLSDIQLLQSTTMVKSTPARCSLVEDFSTPLQKRLKISQSSEQNQLSTTQLLQTPTSTQKSHQFAPLRTLEQENVRGACIVVPESPPADRCLEPYNCRQDRTTGKLMSVNFAGLNAMQCNQKQIYIL